MSATADSNMFQVAITADVYNADGSTVYKDLGLSLLEKQPHIFHGPFDEHRPQIGADQIGDAHGVLVFAAAVTTESVSNCKNLLAFGRFGVGYDNVDVEACTEADVLLYTTAGAVDYPVATATLTWMLALSHHVRVKDELVRSGRWHDRNQYMGCELRDRTLGIIGLGGIGRALIKLLDGFAMSQPIAFDPFIDPQIAKKFGVELVELDELLKISDFVSIHCPLNKQTRNLIGGRELALMKPNAYLINTARGGIVNEDALYEVLANHRIAGAAIDCYENEPITKPHRFGEFENTLLAPHSIAWTDEMFADIGRAACQGMVDLSLGHAPRSIINPQVLESQGFAKKWRRFTSGR